MPKRSKKGLKKTTNTDIVSDVKLSDFANSSARCGRLRKSAGNSFSKEFVGSYDDDTLWYERDLEEFQLLEIAQYNKKKQLRSKAPAEESQNGPGTRYPIDVWFLIGQAIQPEDVKKFALICKDSYFVSRSYSFWLRMYKRYYKPGLQLPPRLQPDCIEQQSFCLKTSVIRALYHMYPQFSNRISSRNSNSDVYLLSNLCCTLMWRIQENGKWIFHFKFQTNDSRSATRLTCGVAINDLWNSQDAEQGKKQEIYVNHNPDEGCKILRFSCSHFVVVPPLVMGSRLSDVRINLAHDMRHQKLQLSFSYANYRLSNKPTNMSKENGYGDIVEFDAVENLMVLNWWHPQYPSDYKI